MNSMKKGFSLVEVMITLFIMTVALIGTMSAFPYIMRGILMTKAKSIANIVVQEQLEAFRNLPYYKIHVTSSPLTDSRFDNVSYDIGYYPKETTSMGGIQYEKMSYVEKVSETEGGDFTHVDWNQPDVGMKRVTVNVAYHSEGGGGDWKKVTMSILVENPDRQQLNATLSGIVKTTAAATTPIPHAGIYVLENPAFNTSSDNSGNYSFSVPAGSWTLVTSATGYFMDTSTPVVCSSGVTTTRNIPLIRKFLGNVTGYAFINDHLVITQVVPSYQPGAVNQEFVELYNPTTYSILIASKSAAGGTYDLWYVTVTYIDNHDAEPSADPDSKAKYLLGNPSHANSVFKAFRTTSTAWDLRFASQTAVYVPSQSFFLLANVSTVAYGAGSFARTADAYYRTSADGDLNIIENSGPGGVRVTGAGGYSFNGQSDWHDGFAWGNAATAPSLSRESANGFAFDTAANYHFYRQQGNQFAGGHDHWSSCIVGNCLPLRNSASPSANCWDSDNNAAAYTHSSYDGDWWYDTNITAAGTYDFVGALYNADISYPPSTGTPAKGALVSANDGLSAVAYVQSKGSFTLTNVATGYWTVDIISSTPRKPYYQEIFTWMGATTPFLGIPNSLTTPPWNNSVNFSSLSFTTTNGVIAGRVTDAAGSGISNITVDAGGWTATTNTQGRYRLRTSTGTYTTGCNLISTNYSYTKDSSANVVVELGLITDAIDFTLVTGGNISGFVSANGVDGLLGYVVSLQRDGAEYKTATTDTGGNFLITNVATCSAANPYLLFLVTDGSEAVDISTGKAVIPTMGTTLNVGNFLITSGYGIISGHNSYGGQSIETGSLIIASTQAITTLSSGPVVNSGLVNGPEIYYFATSDGSGDYSMKVLGGVTSYNIYGYYTDDTVSSSTARISSVTVPMAVGERRTVNLQW